MAERKLITGPTFEEMLHPHLIDPEIRAQANNARTEAPLDSINLFNITWRDIDNNIQYVVLPPELTGKRFDAIVSAYVFHHVELLRKVEICRSLATHNLTPNGKLVVADLSFQNQAAMDAFARSIGGLWEAEPYWLVEDTLPTLEQAGLNVDYEQVSACAGVYTIR